MTEVIVKTQKPNPIVKMIVPGRRALGEAWQEITIAVKDDRIQVTESVPAEAPPDNVPIYSFGMEKLSADAVNFILEGALQKQEYTRRKPKRRPVSDKEIEKMVNDLWLNWCEAKVQMLKGTTFSAPGTFNQRENPGIQNWTGVNPR